MIINKEEIEKAAEEYCNTQNIHPSDITLSKEIFMAGELMAESKFNEFFLDIICENQGLKFYKDNEAERFKKFAVEFGEWILQNDNPGFKLVFGDGLPNKWGSVRQGGGYNTTEELYELFLKERNEKN